MLVVGGAVLGGALVVVAVLMVVSDGFRGEPSAAAQYVEGLSRPDADLVEAHTCPEVWAEVEAFPGGFEAALQETLGALPGPVEHMERRRGSSVTAAVAVWTSNGGQFIFFIDVDASGGRRILCPPGPTELLGTLETVISPVD